MVDTLPDLHRKFESAVNSGDLDALAALYEPNAVLIPSPGQIARGMAEIRSALAGLLSTRPTIRLETATVFETTEGIALLHGKWTLKATGPDGNPFETAGTSAEIARRQPGGGWLYLLDNPYGS